MDGRVREAVLFPVAEDAHLVDMEVRFILTEMRLPRGIGLRHLPVLAYHLAKVKINDKGEFTVGQGTVYKILGEGQGAGQAGQEESRWDQPSALTAHFVEGPAEKEKRIL